MYSCFCLWWGIESEGVFLSWSVLSEECQNVKWMERGREGVRNWGRGRSEGMRGFSAWMRTHRISKGCRYLTSYGNPFPFSPHYFQLNINFSFLCSLESVCGMCWRAQCYLKMTQSEIKGVGNPLMQMRNVGGGHTTCEGRGYMQLEVCLIPMLGFGKSYIWGSRKGSSVGVNSYINCGKIFEL